MTADELRAAIARDCPHRLVDYDAHLANFARHGWPITKAFCEFWRQEHAISSQPRVEARIDRLYRRAQKSRYRWQVRRLTAKASRIRHEITKGLKGPK
ncbi:hypothetical protein [Streptomyces racemochromogenes]|uniref:hypothetical protein n=1 Tax=Streptomyces racemochromogenes TaxID=67353 RepID=UPI0031E6CFB3